jgi:hypothetical protein
MAISWAGLALAQWRARSTGHVLEEALRSGLGGDYREQIPAARRTVLRDSVPALELLLPFALYDPRMERIRDIRYADDHARLGRGDTELSAEPARAVSRPADRLQAGAGLGPAQHRRARR